MNEWIRVTPCENIPLREGRVVRLVDREIAVFNLGDRFLAVENRCPHRGGPLADGLLAGESVVCPLHGWKIGLRTGTVERPTETPACVKTFATRVEAGMLLLDLAPEATPAFANCNGHDVMQGAGSHEVAEMEGARNETLGLP